ncbi:RTA1 like protein-domain-containing protein [Mycena latifolia]|nr:RTA1 like protein-domain-containing protein [Mycena latifolia]
MARSILRSLILFAVLASALADDADSDPPLGGFVPKRLPAYLGLGLYAFSALVQWILYFRHGRPRFMLVLTIGMTSMAVGFAIRLLFAGSPHSIALDVIMAVVIVLSPCAFLATDYMVFARLTMTFDDEVAKSCLLVRRERITKLFLWSDVVTFLLQGNGASLAASSSTIVAAIGKWMTIIGLVLQLISFAFFTYVLILFVRRLRSRFPEVWRPPLKGTRRPFTAWGTHAVEDWRILYWTLGFTCAVILIRSVFRVAEYSGGPTGYLSTHEGYFYAFDALPLWLAMSLYCVVWPTRFFHRHARASGSEAFQLRGISGGGAV